MFFFPFTFFHFVEFEVNFLSIMPMPEPINKKSGFEFRRERQQKSKAQEEIVQKTLKINKFKKKIVTTDRNGNNVPELQECNAMLPSENSNGIAPEIINHLSLPPNSSPSESNFETPPADQILKIRLILVD